MTFAPVALHRAMRARLVATPAVIAAVPVAQIVDAQTRPEAPAVIQIGEGTALRENLTLSRRHARVLAKLDVWTLAGGTSAARNIAGLVADALRADLDLADGFRILDQQIERVVFSRDPSSERGHATLYVGVLIEEPIQ
ncbi:DUF3168 domain-containing protein [Hansschlegelia zhihuaiae]|uniref:DUF3168 domain-containing protein n=1 Tax=Hansschlegelia zhihuaiae TaxID=405005 RepID=A0A4Q0M916_9HYPH|nr:DUF3168 domain-containing protein [Hansschlegelia zhihuaiae]RXF69239.1 DUF3168 domain-containing protein [Hansschlegelia zhihuaiae]